MGFDAESEMTITVVCGPTAVGKSLWAIQEAQRVSGEIISADAFQVYRGMDIGTAKVSLSERALVPHHLIDCMDPMESYSVADFLKRVEPVLADIRKRGKYPIICGGTAFYLQAFLYGYQFSDHSVDRSAQEAFSLRLESEGLSVLVEELLAKEPVCSDWMDLSNARRVIRALIQLEQGISPTKASKESQSLRSDVSIVGLRMERSLLIERINARVEGMLSDGLVEEVEGLLSLGVSSTCQAFQGIGYKEVVDYLQGRLGYADMVDCIKTRTRQFAKRQMTWFRRFEQVTWYDVA